jgi:hypothetical protein
MRECFRCIFDRPRNSPASRESEREIGIGNDVAWRNNVHSDCPSLSLSMHGCVCAGIQKTRLAIPFRKSGRTRRTRGGKEVAKSRLPATQQREPAHLRSSLLLHREWGTFEQNQSSQHPTRWEICSASKLYCAAAIAVSLLTRRSFFLFQHFAKWPIK